MKCLFFAYFRSKFCEDGSFLLNFACFLNQKRNLIFFPLNFMKLNMVDKYELYEYPARAWEGQASYKVIVLSIFRKAVRYQALHSVKLRASYRKVR
jgi:hypothetical protein